MSRCSLGYAVAAILLWPLHPARIPPVPALTNKSGPTLGCCGGELLFGDRTRVLVIGGRLSDVCVTRSTTHEKNRVTDLDVPAGDAEAELLHDLAAHETDELFDTRRPDIIAPCVEQLSGEALDCDAAVKPPCF